MKSWNWLFFRDAVEKKWSVSRRTRADNLVQRPSLRSLFDLFNVPSPKSLNLTSIHEIFGSIPLHRLKYVIFVSHDFEPIFQQMWGIMCHRSLIFCKTTSWKMTRQKITNRKYQIQKLDLIELPMVGQNRMSHG